MGERLGGYRGPVPNHLEPVPSEPPDLFDSNGDDHVESFEGDEISPLVRPVWWRWVALLVVVAMIAAGPFAYVLSKLLR